VGRIISIGPRASTMALLTHRGLSIAARLSDCRAEGVLHGKVATGDDNAERLCTLAIVGRELNAKPGENVMTSGFDGTFPAGLWLGVVTAAKKTNDMQWEVLVRPACDENAIECVQIITVAPPEVPWPIAPAVRKK
jgi:cell shape-determining protein MreC